MVVLGGVALAFGAVVWGGAAASSALVGEPFEATVADALGAATRLPGALTDPASAWAPTADLSETPPALYWLATGRTVGGTPMNTRTGAMRKPPPIPKIPEINPTRAPNATNRGAFTDTSAMGR